MYESWYQMENKSDDELQNIEDIKRNRHHKDRRASRIIIKVSSWSLILFGLLLTTGIGIFVYYAKDAPKISKTKMQSAGSSALYTQNEKLLLILENS